MSWYDDHHRDHHRDDPRPSLDEELRSALGQEPSFDYDALIDGSKQRARRIRRRRTVAQVAAAAVLVPTLVVTGYAAGQRLSVPGGPDDQAQVAAQTQQPTAEDATTATATDDEATTPVTPGRPPYQDGVPPAPEGGMDAGDGNRLEIPDARPSGVALLDELGAPQAGAFSPRAVPVLGFLYGNGVSGAEAHSGVYWTYFDPAAGMATQSVDIVLTAWDDSSGPMAQLRGEATGYGFGWTSDLGGELSVGGTSHSRLSLPWPGHEDDQDHLLVTQQTTGVPGHAAGAVIRQGDYLVGITVNGPTQEEAVASATEIAERTAANLAALDPEHGQG